MYSFISPGAARQTTMETNIRDSVREFNLALNTMMDLLRRKSRSEEEQGQLLQIESLIKIARMAGVDSIVKSSVDLFVFYSEIIDSKERREEFINQFDPHSAFTDQNGEINDEGKLYVALISSIRRTYQKSNQTDRDIAWQLLTQMKKSAITYGLLTHTENAGQ